MKRMLAHTPFELVTVYYILLLKVPTLIQPLWHNLPPRDLALRVGG